MTLPDANHDWNTISIEEVQVGSWAITKINGKNGLLHPFFMNLNNLGI